MKNILIVKYAPTKQNSFTEKLLGQVELAKFQGRKVVIRDLNITPPPLFNTDSMNAYVKRNFEKQDLSEVENQFIAEFDKLCEEFILADLLILAFPMYNFSIPASIKAWIDAIAQAGKTFKYTEFGPIGTQEKKHVLVLTSTGGTTEDSPRNFSTPYIKSIFRFMGIKEIGIVSINQSRNQSMLDEYFKKAKLEINKFLINKFDSV